MENREKIEFEAAHQSWIQQHLKKRNGEGKDRLNRGHAHGEVLFLKEVWWPLFGHFDDLHPEFEVKDWRGATSYLDFAWLPGIHRFNIDVKGYGPHVQQADRTRYSRELMRELYLQTIGYRNLSIPYDVLKENPSLIRSMLASILLPYAEAKVESKRRLTEKALLDFARRQSAPFSPMKAASELGLSSKTAGKHLRRLVEEGKLKSYSPGIRNYRYAYLPHGWERQ